MLFGSFIDRRNAHEAGDMQAVLAPAICNETVGVSHANPGLLLFIAGIDLNEERKLPLLLCHFLGNGVRDSRPVDAVNHIEQLHRFGGLVALQGADEVELQPRRGCLEGRPFTRRLLDTVFTKVHLSGLQDGHDFVRAKGLADRNERDLAGLAANGLGSQFNPSADILKRLMMR